MAQNIIHNRLFLFDIDGTLLHAHGVPRIAMQNVLEKKYKHFAYTPKFSFSGMTDWEIVERLLIDSGLKQEIYKENVFSILNDFNNEMQNCLKNSKPPHIYNGVIQLLKYLEQDINSYLGLLTGNNKNGAEIKLKSAGIDHYFSFGAFGDDAKNRSDLARFAIDRAEQKYNLKFDNDDTWIIGDSKNDIKCARENNLRCLAVCTGWDSKTDLLEENPEYIVDDFKNTKEIIEILVSYGKF